MLLVLRRHSRHTHSETYTHELTLILQSVQRDTLTLDNCLLQHIDQCNHRIPMSEHS